MDAAFGFKELFTYLIGDMAKAVSEREGEAVQQQFARSQAATHAIMSFLPRDAIEAMLAGHCVMLHEMIVDSTHDTMRGETNRAQRAARGSIVAMDKAFGNNLDRLERYQKRQPDGRRDTPPAQPPEAPVETEIADRVRRHRGETRPPAAREQAVPAASPPAESREADACEQAVPTRSQDTRQAATDFAPRAPETGSANAPCSPETIAAFQATDLTPKVAKTGPADAYYPAPETIAACQANPEAMAALDAGDAEGFARAMGVDRPSEGYLAAAASGQGPFRRPGSGNPAPGEPAARAAIRSAPGPS